MLRVFLVAVLKRFAPLISEVYASTIEASRFGNPFVETTIGNHRYGACRQTMKKEKFISHFIELNVLEDSSSSPT